MAAISRGKGEDVGDFVLGSFLDALPEGKQALRTNKMSPWYIYDIDNINE